MTAYEFDRDARELALEILRQHSGPSIMSMGQAVDTARALQMGVEADCSHEECNEHLAKSVYDLGISLAESVCLEEERAEAEAYYEQDARSYRWQLPQRRQDRW